MHLLRGILCLTAFIALLPLSAQHNKDINLRWGVTAGMNGFNANSLNLSDHRGRYGFNIAARAELDFANSMYLDAELGLLNLGWKDRGQVLAGGVFEAGAVAGQPVLDQAFRFGASL